MPKATATAKPKATSKANAVNSIEPKKAKKIPIRKVLKDLVWSKWIGDDIARHSCLCCGVNEIKMNQFHCGHIIAESNGGITSIENLKPICAHCNLSMSTDNFDDFRKRCGFDVPVKPTAKPKTQAVRKTKITELLINGSLSLCPGTEERYRNIGSISKSSPCNDSYFTNFTKHCDRCNNHYHVGLDTSKLCPCFSIR
jgi:5-methylcytosine-specific restriction endonuclease McrA